MDGSYLHEAIANLNRHWQNLAYVILILVCTLVVTLAIHAVLRKRYKRDGVARDVWRDAFIGALNAPLQGAIWIVGLSLAVAALTANGRLPEFARIFSLARDVAAIAVVAWFLVRLVRRATRNLSARATQRGTSFDETAADAIRKVSSALIIAVALMIIIQALGFSVASLLTFGGVAGIAVGFAAQGLVANLLGGITIYASRPFIVGEYIIFPGSELMGEVQHIGWRATRILGFDRKPFYVPNAKFNTETIINHSRLTNRRIMEYVHLRLEDIDKVPGIVREVNRMIGAHPEIDHDFFVFNFDGYGDYALKLFLYAFTTSTGYVDYMRIKEDLLLKVAALVADHGARLALPVSTMYMPEGLHLRREYGPGAREPGAAGVEEPSAAAG